MNSSAHLRISRNYPFRWPPDLEGELNPSAEVEHDVDIFVIEGPGLWDRVAGGGRCLTYFLLSSQSSYIISVLLHNGMSDKTSFWKQKRDHKLFKKLKSKQNKSQKKDNFHNKVRAETSIIYFVSFFLKRSILSSSWSYSFNPNHCNMTTTVQRLQ